jgi:glycosyltransferase involved in cell wall biosynthesis
MQPLISILIPCYNGERWIARAIESALAQTWSTTEVIVVDDGSTDNSLNVIRAFDGRIRWETGPNRGGNAARNRLLELARGDWVQYLDADDYLLPYKIKLQMDALAGSNDADLIYGSITLEDWSNGHPRLERMPIHELEDVWEALALWHLPQTGSPLCRKLSIEQVGGWNDAQPCCQEHELYLRLLIAGKKFKYYPCDGAVYRQWSDATVSKKEIKEVHRRRLEIEQKIEDHLRRTNQLTSERMRAISQARFEIARGAYQYDPEFASSIVKNVKLRDPDFSPTGNAAPLHYRLAFRLFGFDVTESLARGLRTRWA